MVQEKIRRAAAIALVCLLTLSTSSCRAADDLNRQTGKPANRQTGPQTASDELVYLKVENAAASGFDESPDWAPKPDAMAAVDANLETRWASGYKDGEWIYFDFGKEKTVSKILIKWEQAYAATFEILASDDGTDWKRIILLENQAGGATEVGFEPVTARYVKVLGLVRVNPEWGISMWEFEAYGPRDKNPGEAPYDEIFKSNKETSEIEKKRQELGLSNGQIVKSPGPITIDEFQKGVNYTSWDRDELGKQFSDYSLIHLSQLSVKHVALMVVYYQDDAASKKIYPDEKKTVSDESLAHAINIIHALGMKVMLKPHVDLVDEEARSNIIPSDEWFASYKFFILRYARLAAQYDCELLCVGTELSNTSTMRWKGKWLDIIGAVKSVYSGPITYAANWDEYDTVSFWDSVDFIGMDAYFPLTDKNNPAKEELEAAWERHAQALEKWRADNKLNKPVIFTEIGYDTVEGSNKQPWRILPTLAKYVESQDEQANCLDSLLAALSKRSWFKGLYWWNYFPRPDIGPLGYTLRGKKGEKVLAEWYGKLK